MFHSSSRLQLSAFVFLLSLFLNFVLPSRCVGPRRLWLVSLELQPRVTAKGCEPRFELCGASSRKDLEMMYCNNALALCMNDPITKVNLKTRFLHHQSALFVT